MVTGAAGLTIRLTPAFGFGGVTVAAANFAGVNDNAFFVCEACDAGAETFSYSAKGADSVLTYGTDGSVTTAFESIVLIGYITGATIFAAGGWLTVA